jgi:hypothetical protein
MMVAYIQDKRKLAAWDESARQTASAVQSNNLCAQSTARVEVKASKHHVANNTDAVFETLPSTLSVVSTAEEQLQPT